MKKQFVILVLFTLFFSCQDKRFPQFPSSKTSAIIKVENKYPRLTKNLTFWTTDSLKITADYYETHPDSIMIIAFHKEQYNKSSYTYIAPRINRLGFNLLAIDQRSGGILNGIENQTFKRADSLGFETDFLNVKTDIISAIDFTFQKINRKSVILLGSSYSATFVLEQLAVNPKVKAAIAFSPNDYFKTEKDSLKTLFPKLQKPFWIASSQKEIPQIDTLTKNVQWNKYRIYYKPETEGFYGAKALWKSNLAKGGFKYWQSLELFLKELQRSRL